MNSVNTEDIKNIHAPCHILLNEFSAASVPFVEVSKFCPAKKDNSQDTLNGYCIAVVDSEDLKLLHFKSLQKLRLKRTQASQTTATAEKSVTSKDSSAAATKAGTHQRMGEDGSKFDASTLGAASIQGKGAMVAAVGNKGSPVLQQNKEGKGALVLNPVKAVGNVGEPTKAIRGETASAQGKGERMASTGDVGTPLSSSHAGSSTVIPVKGDGNILHPPKLLTTATTTTQDKEGTIAAVRGKGTPTSVPNAGSSSVNPLKGAGTNPTFRKATTEGQPKDLSKPVTVPINHKGSASMESTPIKQRHTDTISAGPGTASGVMNPHVHPFAEGEATIQSKACDPCPTPAKIPRRTKRHAEFMQKDVWGVAYTYLHRQVVNNRPTRLV